MSEPIIEQIAQWLFDALDGKQDPDGTITFRSVRSELLNIVDLQLINGDILIEFLTRKTQSTDMNSFRDELGTFRVTGYVNNVPDGVYADTYLLRVAETICKYLMAANADSSPLDGLALSVDCPEYVLMDSDGGVDVIVTCNVEYSTNIYNGFEQ